MVLEIAFMLPQQLFMEAQMATLYLTATKLWHFPEEGSYLLSSSGVQAVWNSLTLLPH